MWQVAAAVVLLAAGTHAATCGGSGIPFRFEVLPSGQPVLGCASPQCFGAENGGKDLLHDSQFNPGPDGEDGFFREGDLERTRSRYRDAPSQQAECPSGFGSSACTSSLSWVGGILADPNGELSLQCCRYDGLRFATEVGRPLVHAGEVYSGGEVIRDGRQTGFDLITNVKRIQEEDGTIGYELTVSRMNCMPDPPEMENDVKINAEADITRILDKVSDAAANGAAIETDLGPLADAAAETPLLSASSNTIDAADVPQLSSASSSFSDASAGLQSGNAQLSSVETAADQVVDQVVDQVDQSQPTNFISPGVAAGGAPTYAASADTYVQPQQQPAGAPTVEQEQYVQVGEQVVPIQSPGYYYPVSSGIPACFTGDTQVETPAGFKRMDQLRIGDHILTMEQNASRFTTVESWLHRLPETEAYFIHLKTENEHALKLTPQHFIYKVNCERADFNTEMMYAEDMQVGDCLYTLGPDRSVYPTRVTSVSVVKEKGVYAPMTSAGDLLANDVFVSCHNVVKANTLSHTFLHFAESVHRTLRRISGADSASSELDSLNGGHLPPSTEFFLSVIDYIIPHKL